MGYDSEKNEYFIKSSLVNRGVLIKKYKKY